MKKFSFLVVLFFAINPIFAADFPTIEEWTPTGDVSTFTPDTLWEHINGAAETFIQYGFVELKTAELSKDNVTVSVGIYEMGSPLNAFGIYRTELPEGQQTIKIGTQALVSAPYQALLVKDRFYVKVDVYDGEIDDAAGRSILIAIAKSLPGSDEMPKAFAKLPTEGQIPGSLQFTREAFLGVRELKHCISAFYDLGTNEPVRYFVMLIPKGSTVDQTWQALAEKWTVVSTESAPVLSKKVPYSGLVGVIRSGETIYGVAGSKNEAELLKNLADISGGS